MKKFLVSKTIEVLKNGPVEGYKRINAWFSEEDVNVNTRFFKYLEKEYIGSWSTGISTPIKFNEEIETLHQISTSKFDSSTVRTVGSGCMKLSGIVNIGRLLELNQDIFIELKSSHINTNLVKNEYYRNGELCGASYDYASQIKQADSDRYANVEVRPADLNPSEFTMNYED